MPSNLPRIAGLALAGLLILVPHETLAQRYGRGGYYPGGGYGGYGYRGYAHRGGYGRYGYGYRYPAYAYPGYGYPPYPAYRGYYGYGGAGLAAGMALGAALARRHHHHHHHHYVQVPVQAPAIQAPTIAPPPADPMQTCPDGSVVPANSYCPRIYRGAGAQIPREIARDDLRDD